MAEDKLKIEETEFEDPQPLLKEEADDKAKSDFSPLDSSFESSQVDRFLQETDVYPSQKVIPVNSLKREESYSVSGLFYTDFTNHEVTNTVTETLLNSVVIPANSVHSGMTFRIHGGGSAKTTSSVSDITFSWGFGASAPNTTLNTFTLNNRLIPQSVFSFDWYVTIKTSGTNGTIGGTVMGNLFILAMGDDYQETTSFDTTDSFTLSLTTQLSVQSAAEFVTLDQWLVEVLG